MGKTTDAAFTDVEVRTLATEFETREKTRDADVARQLKKLGVNIPNNGKGNRNAQAKNVRGGKGKDGKGKGGKKGGKAKGGNRRTRRQTAQNDEAPPSDGALVPGIDGTVVAHMQCYGCQNYGHGKKKWGVVQCPYWVIDADGSEYYDPNHKPSGAAAGAPVAPRAVVDQVAATPVATAAAFDMDAMFEAMALSDAPDDETRATMKQMYLTAANRNAASTKAVALVLPACALGVSGTAPSGQNFRARFGADGALGAVEVVDDDSGSPVSLVSPAKAAQLVVQGLAKYLPGKSLFKSFTGVVSASGHDLGYTRDLELTVHPLGLDGRPSKVGFTIVVHVVSEYQSNGLLLGTQQQVLWGMETSCKTGLKTITAPVAQGGAEFTFPFSVTSDGTSIGPQTVRSVTLGGSELAPSNLPSAAPATSPDQGLSLIHI